MRIASATGLVLLTLACAGCATGAPRQPGDDGVKADLGHLGVEGKTYVHDLAESANILLHSVQRMDGDLLLQDVHGHLTYVDGTTLNPKWDYYGLDEPFTHRPSFTPSAIVGVSGGKLHSLTRDAGVPIAQPRWVDVVPSAGPVANDSTVYIPTYRTPAGNKTVYSTGIVSNYLGWGWRTPSDVSADLAKGGPLGGDTLYCASEDGSLLAFEMAPASAAQPSPAWTAHAQARVRHDLVVAGDDLGVVTLDGRLICFDRITGNIRWEAYADAGEKAESKAQFSTDHAFYRRGGALHAFDRETGDPQWKVKGATGFIAERGDRMLLAGNGGWVIAVETATGEILGRRKFKGMVFPPQPEKDGTIHAVSTSGLIVAVETGW